MKKHCSPVFCCFLLLIVCLFNISLSFVHSSLTRANRVSNCSMIYIPSSSSSSQQQYSLLTCTSIVIPNETTVNYRYEDTVQFSLFYPFFDSKYSELCSAVVTNQLFTKYNIDSCSSLFCNSIPQLIGKSFEQSNNISSTVKNNLLQHYNVSSSQKTRQVIAELAYLVNYCQYCNRDDFISFHTTLNSTQCFTFVSANFCNYNQPPNNFQTLTIDSLTASTVHQLDYNQESELEIPLLHGISLLNQDVFLPWQCSCGQLQYAFKCDYFSTLFIPFTFRAYPIICFVLTLLLMVVCVFTLVIPTIYRNVKNAKVNMKNNLMPIQKAVLEEVISISWLIIVFLMLHLIFSALENLLSLATVGMFQAKSSIGKFIQFLLESLKLNTIIANE
ncbi:predicted protein [Naegleria gruberi]|uniref:Predicted protein n=1 Tax=Naegleria gruberi TaxID=5762 RepID=D2V2X4_NAEGR|nr:uncharacterized protein NAEGRDRAFT_78348 [Naegleria gruberi]EFC49137.1 predicted protein [Naegleria gruberi]|eukprot:XP_002681881.1 predicted protein [Naegleria gruberi strain NEG-M]